MRGPGRLPPFRPCPASREQSACRTQAPVCNKEDTGACRRPTAASASARVLFAFTARCLPRRQPLRGTRRQRQRHRLQSNPLSAYASVLQRRSHSWSAPHTANVTFNLLGMLGQRASGHTRHNIGMPFWLAGISPSLIVALCLPRAHTAPAAAQPLPRSLVPPPPCSRLCGSNRVSPIE